MRREDHHRPGKGNRPRARSSNGESIEDEDENEEERNIDKNAAKHDLQFSLCSSWRSKGPEPLSGTRVTITEPFLRCCIVAR
jgi:hypothetical protein